jgi:DNA-binding response OmpR family regulator
MLTILLADDDRLMGAALRRCIENFSITVRSAHTVETAVRIARHDPFDAILLDFDLKSQRTANPRSGGGLRALRALRAGRVETPVFVLCALSDDIYEETLLEAGADKVVVKTDGVSHLIHRLRVQLQRRGKSTNQIVAISADS